MSAVKNLSLCFKLCCVGFLNLRKMGLDSFGFGTRMCFCSAGKPLNHHDVFAFQPRQLSTYRKRCQMSNTLSVLPNMHPCVQNVRTLAVGSYSSYFHSFSSEFLLFCLFSFRLKLMSCEHCISSWCCNGKLCKILLCRTLKLLALLVFIPTCSQLYFWQASYFQPV